MALIINSTKNTVTSGIKALVYGSSGSGKTRLSSTLPGNTLILSAEAGLLSLREFDIDSVTISKIQDLRDAYNLIESSDGDKYQNIVLDSLSEIAEQILTHELTVNKDPRQAYGQLASQMIGLTKAFRDMVGKNVVCIAKSERSKDESTGALMYAPAFPGNKLTLEIPYLFDELLYLHAVRDNDTGEVKRYLQTTSDNKVTAKDRSGALDQYENADMAEIFNKINGKKAEKKEK